MDIKQYIREIHGSSDYYNRFVSEMHRNYLAAERKKASLKTLSTKSSLHDRAWKLALETYYNTECTYEGAERWARAVLWAKGRGDWKTRDVSVMLIQGRDLIRHLHPDMWVVHF